MIIQHIKNNQIRIIEKYLMKKNAVVIMEITDSLSSFRLEKVYLVCHKKMSDRDV